MITLSDSAFKVQDYQGLVVRGCIILLIEAGACPSGGSPPAIKPGQEVRRQVLDCTLASTREWYGVAEMLSLIHAVG